MLSTESRRERALFERVHDGVWWPEELLEDDEHSFSSALSSIVRYAKRTSDNLGKEEQLGGLVDGAGSFAIIRVSLVGGDTLC
jgi:hypothetical protein